MNRPEDIVVGHLDVLGPPAFVLVRIDEPDRLAHGPLLLVHIEGADHALDEAQLVVRVEYLEVLRKSGLPPMHAQQPMGDAVERANPHGARGSLQQAFHASPHLGRGLVREGDRENAAGRCP